MNKQWYYVENGDRKGPYPANELKGKIQKDTLLWCEGMKDWKRADEISEFKSFFEVIPPPIPGSKEANQATGNRISNSVLYAYTFAVLAIIACIIELTGNEDSKYYAMAIFLSGTSLVRVFLGIRSYFSKILHNDKLTAIVTWLIATLIPIYLFEVLATRKGFEDRFNDELGVLLFVIVMFSAIIHIYQFIRFRIKLAKVDGVGHDQLKMFASLQLIFFPVSILLIAFFEEESSMSILYTILQLVPIYFLITGLQKIENQFIAKTA
ncbi:DUF4339 domain-containing protein [Marinifilum caeruleilacunae]|nr:DUF4339 domain-containing protein [Marinifilum caeruleilacunae]